MPCRQAAATSGGVLISIVAHQVPPSCLHCRRVLVQDIKLWGLANLADIAIIYPEWREITLSSS
jgi:hypothetical protein